MRSTCMFVWRWGIGRIPLRERSSFPEAEVFRWRGRKIWKVEQKHPLLLNGANVPDNLIEKEIPLKIPPHSLAKCNCVQKFALLLPDFFLDQEFSSWHGELWQSIINFIIKNLIEILSHWIGNWVKSWFNLFSSFHIPVQIWKCRTDSFKSGTANRIQWRKLYKHLQIQCVCFFTKDFFYKDFRHIVQTN